MPDFSGPFDTSTWSVADWARHMAAAIPSGVIDVRAASATTGGLALLTSGLTVGLDQGKANVGGFGFFRTGAQTPNVAVPANTNASLSRRDRLVLRRDVAANTITPKLIQGVPAATPLAPAVTQGDTVWDLPMFSFLVPPSSGTILSGIVDERIYTSDRVVDRLRITGAADASLTSTDHGYQIGPDNGQNLVMTPNGFVPRNNGVLSAFGVGGARIFALGAPIGAGDAATKGYVDAAAKSYSDGTTGTLPLIGGWSVLAGYHTPFWNLSGNGWVTLNGAVFRTAANFALGTGTPFQFATLPAELAPAATISPITFVGLGTSSPAATYPARLYCPGGSRALSVVGMDSGSGTMAQNIGYINLDGVTWRV